MAWGSLMIAEDLVLLNATPKQGIERACSQVSSQYPLHFCEVICPVPSIVLPGGGLRALKGATLMYRHELPSDKALLRLRHYNDATPEANGGNAAMHLANYALHAVAARSGRMQDPRMRSLRSVAHLQVQQTREVRIGSIINSEVSVVYGQASLQERA